MSALASPKQAPHAERGLDVYETPEVAVSALLRAEGHRMPSAVWEPAAGPGSIVRTLRASGLSVFASDVVHYGDHQDAWRTAA